MFGCAEKIYCTKYTMCSVKASSTDNLNQAVLSINCLSSECLASSFLARGIFIKAKTVRYHKAKMLSSPIWRGIIRAAILLPTCSSSASQEPSARLHSRIAHNGEIILVAPSPNSPHTKYKGEPPCSSPPPRVMTPVGPASEPLRQ